jgi:hypothetical protein
VPRGAGGARSFSYRRDGAGVRRRTRGIIGNGWKVGKVGRSVEILSRARRACAWVIHLEQNLSGSQLDLTSEWITGNFLQSSVYRFGFQKVNRSGTG